MVRSFLTPFISAQTGDPFLSLHRDINRLFDETLRGPAPSQGAQQGAAMISAPVNVAETQDEYRVTAELPGLSSEDVEVLLDEDVLTIRGERRFERRDDKESYHLIECSYGTVQRSLRLPAPVDAQQVQANFENGLLRITLPKSKAQERARRIEVQGGAGDQARRLGGEPQQHNGGSGGVRDSARASGGKPSPQAPL
jgi:HSP20 family protein